MNIKKSSRPAETMRFPVEIRMLGKLANFIKRIVLYDELKAIKR